MRRRVLTLLIAVAAMSLVALVPAAADARTRRYKCTHLRGGGTRAHPWRVRARNYQRTIVRCPGFPLGQGAPDYYVFRVPRRIDRNDNVALWTRPTARAPAEIGMVLDDLGPFANYIYGHPIYDGAYAGRYLNLLRDPVVLGKRYYLRAQRFRAVSSAPRYRIVFDFR